MRTQITHIQHPHVDETTTFWMGRPLHDLTRQELVDIIGLLSQLNDNLMHQSIADFGRFLGAEQR